MLYSLLILVVTCGSYHLRKKGQTKYLPTWDSLDARPLPSWYDEAKFGIFIHWGVFSVPSFGCEGATAAEWYWWSLDGAKDQCVIDYHKKTFGENFEYADFAPLFKPTLYDPDAWVDLFEKSGAKYVVLTSKHHDGFCNWPSDRSWNWNSGTCGPRQDNIQMLADAVRKSGSMKFGLYHSLFEWFHPLYLEDKASGYKTSDYVDTILWPQLKDIVERYKPSIVWADGDWEASDDYWKSKEFLSWLYNDSPVKDEVCVNDRWGKGDTCNHGGYYTCSDRYQPGHKVTHKWENCFTIDKGSWGYNRNTPLDQYLTRDEVINSLMETVACGGNLLLNIGPGLDGSIRMIFQERLLQLGEWLSVNGEAIYASKPYHMANDTAAGIWYTTKGKTVYACMLAAEKKKFVSSVELTVPKPMQNATVYLLGQGEVSWKENVYGSMTLILPIQMLADGLVFKLENVV